MKCPDVPNSQTVSWLWSLYIVLLSLWCVCVCVCVCACGICAVYSTRDYLVELVCCTFAHNSINLSINPPSSLILPLALLSRLILHCSPCLQAMTVECMCCCLLRLCVLFIFKTVLLRKHSTLLAVIAVCSLDPHVLN